LTDQAAALPVVGNAETVRARPPLGTQGHGQRRDPPGAPRKGPFMLPTAVLAIAGTGYGLIGLLVIIVLVLLIIRLV